ncbi:YkvI family membrane protein [Corynebacterium hadale]
MLKNAIGIAFAFIGVLVGAGFASGQETMQYFIAFGTQGIWGAALSSALMLIAGVSILQLGSYFQANEHMEVLGSVSSKVMSWILDIATITTLFSIGFVMYAGAGANLNQQFGWPVWIGATLMLALVLVIGMMDVDKVTAAVGAVTPLLLFFVIFGCIWTLYTSDLDWSNLDAQAQEVSTTLPNWWISSLNYTGLNAICVASMALVIGGNYLDTRAAGLGGFLGGMGYLVMLLLLSCGLLAAVGSIAGDAMPMLTLITNIHPVLGFIMSLVIFGMIFATALGMFFALGKRLARGRQERFRPIFITTCLIGFALSFVGFKTLVSVVYPILGYLGILLVAVLAAAWLRSSQKLRKEGNRRRRARELMRLKLDPRERFTKNDEKELDYIIQASIVDNEELEAALEEEVGKELIDDNEVEYDPEDRDGDVVYVTYTDPQSKEDYAKHPDEPWKGNPSEEDLAAQWADDESEREDGGSTVVSER